MSYHPSAEASSSEEHHIQLLRKQLQQQEQQALAAAAQVRTSNTKTTGFVAILWCRKTGNPIISLHVVTTVAIVTESRGRLSQHVL